MKDKDKTKEQLRDEVEKLRQHIAAQEALLKENKRIIEKLRDSEVSMENDLFIKNSAIESSLTSIGITDLEGMVQYVNDACVKLWGFKSSREMIGMHLTDFWSGERVNQTINNLKAKGHDKGEDIGRRIDGSLFNVLFTANVIKNSRDVPVAMLGSFVDITDRKRMEEKLRAAAMNDDLTRLLNRRGFFTLADQQCKLGTRNKRTMALVYSDFDGLKKINDELGHEAGDQALVDTANIFKKTFRESDIIARIGGDEFAVLLTELPDSSTVNIIINHLRENIKKHNEQGTHNYELSVTTGIALYDPEHSCSISELINQADESMYNNKKVKKV